MKPVMSGLERDLLLAALAQDGREIAAFDRFMENVDFSGPVDPGHYRMLPLAYANLTRAGVPSQRLGLLRGVYRHSWCKSHEHAARATEAVAALGAAGIPVIVSKGIVLARCYYESPAHRPMSDIDLVVPVERVRDAAQVLSQLKYTSGSDITKFSADHFEDFLVSRHSNSFFRQDGSIDLHWYVKKHCRTSAANRRFWGNSCSFDLTAGAQARQLRVDDMLLHVILHGLEWNAMSPLRWVADATMVFRRGGSQIVWDDLFDAAEEFRVEGHFRAGLEALRSFDLVDMPVWPRAPRMSIAERVERWAYGKPYSVNLAVSAVRFAQTEYRMRLPQLAGKWVARRIGIL